MNSIAGTRVFHYATGARRHNIVLGGGTDRVMGCLWGRGQGQGLPDNVMPHRARQRTCTAERKRERRGR